VKPELISTGADNFVSVEAEHADDLRNYLLRHGVPCAPARSSPGPLWLIRLMRSADLGRAQTLLDRWGQPGMPDA
jgi:hypothetical protein